GQVVQLWVGVGLGVGGAVGVVEGVVVVVQVDVAQPAHHQHVEVAGVLLVQPGGEVRLADLHLDAERLEVGGDDLRGGDGLRVVAGGEQVQGATVVAGLGHQVLGLVDVGVVLVVLHVPDALGRDGELVGLGGAVGDGLDDRFPVDRVGDRLPGLHVVPGGVGLVQRQVPVVARRRDAEFQGVVTLELVYLLRRDHVGPLDLPGLQGGQGGGGFGDELILHTRDLRCAAPVVGVRGQGDVVPGGPFLQGERAGAHGGGGDVPGLQVLLVHDRHALEHAEVGQQVRGGLGQGDHHGVVARGGDVGDGGELPGVGELLINDPVVGVGHVLGGEVAAVVEGDVVAQVEGPGEVVVADVPGLGQRRL